MNFAAPNVSTQVGTKWYCWESSSHFVALAASALLLTFYDWAEEAGEWEGDSVSQHEKSQSSCLPCLQGNLIFRPRLGRAVMELWQIQVLYG